MSDRTGRRQFLNTAFLGTAGAGVVLSNEEKTLGTALGAQAQAPAVEPAPPVYEGEPLPHGKLGKLSISRLVLGGNLIGGYAHSRDLLYVSRLLKAYNTEEKICETLALAEQCGVNTVQLHPGGYDTIERYRKERGGKIQVILNVDADYADMTRVRDQIQELVGRGVDALYTHGMNTDRCVMNNDIDRVAQVVELIKKAGVPGGIGSHSLETPIAAEKLGIENDFYVKTLHPDNYWSASPPEARDEWCWYKGFSQDHNGYYDNIFCVDPKRTVETFQAIKKPWFAFKVMAAGALNPQVGFNFAFAGGADFIIAGMFDFQLAADVEIAMKSLKRSGDRTRPWCA